MRVHRVGKSFLWLLATALVATAAACGSSEDSDDTPRVCSEDADCPSGEECQFAAASIQQPIPFNPCVTVQPCSDSSTCSGELVCAPYEPPGGLGFDCPARTCQPPCTPTSCASGEVCGDDGACRYLQCDEPGAEVCPERYRCDPAATAQVSSVNGSTTPDTADPALVAKLGCARKLCDEEGGFECRDTWTCDPSRAANEGSGCVPKPCAEAGRCWDDAAFICEPSNDGPRPEGTDFHGCVRRNCGEGHVCQQLLNGVNYASCDLASPKADVYGCVVRRCDEVPEVCADTFVCDLAAAPGTQNAFGCRAKHCNDPGGPACGTGSVCTPNTVGGYYCATPTVGGGGSGGASAPPSGTAGKSSGGSAGASAAGGVGGDVLVAPPGGRMATGGSANATGGNASGASGSDARGICVEAG